MNNVNSIGKAFNVILATRRESSGQRIKELYLHNAQLAVSQNGIYINRGSSNAKRTGYTNLLKTTSLGICGFADLWVWSRRSMCISREMLFWKIGRADKYSDRGWAKCDGGRIPCSMNILSLNLFHSQMIELQKCARGWGCIKAHIYIFAVCTAGWQKCICWNFVLSSL